MIITEEKQSSSANRLNGSGGNNATGQPLTIKEWESNLQDIANKNKAANREKLAQAYSKLNNSADKWWMRQAVRCVHYLLQKQDEIAADDVWDSMQHISKPNNPRAMGLVFKICHNAGMIIPTGRYRKTRRKQANGREIRVWGKVA